MCSFLLIASPSKRLKLILKLSEIMPLYPGGAFRCGDNGLIHSISFKPVVYHPPAQPQMDRPCMKLQFLANLISTQFAALTCNIHFRKNIHTLKMFDTICINILSERSWTWYCVAYRAQNHIVSALKQSRLKFATNPNQVYQVMGQHCKVAQTANYDFNSVSLTLRTEMSVSSQMGVFKVSIDATVI